MFVCCLLPVSFEIFLADSAVNPGAWCPSSLHLLDEKTRVIIGPIGAFICTLEDARRRFRAPEYSQGREQMLAALVECLLSVGSALHCWP
jgi:hypothetical protein